MRKQIKCPCQDCLMVPMCCNKYLEELLQTCLAFSDYVKFRSVDDIRHECYKISNYQPSRLIKANSILKSNTWELEKIFTKVGSL